MADTKWSNNTDFPLNNSLDGTEQVVGLKSGNNFKTQVSSGIVNYVNANAQLASTSQVTGLNTDLNGKLSLAGGTMLGDLILAGTPVGSNDATTKSYVDSGLSTKISNTGGSISDATGPGPSSNSLFSVSSSVKGIQDPRWTSAQEATNIALLGPSDVSLRWFNTDNATSNYWSGLDRQQLLTVENCIEGTNMSIDKVTMPGKAIFNASGGIGPGTQIQGAFAVIGGLTATSVTVSDSPINVASASFNVINSVGMNVNTATVSGVTTPIIQSASTGGRWGIARFDLTLNFQTSGTNTFTFTIYTNNGSTYYFPDYTTNYVTGTDQVFSISSPLVYLNTNDYMYLTVKCASGSASFIAKKFYGSWVDTTVASIPSTDALLQGSSNFYLSQNGGSTYQYMSGSGVVGNYPKFNSTGGQFADSGVNVGNINVNGGAPSTNTTYYLLFSQNSAANNQIPYAATSLTFQNQSGVNYLTAPMLNLTNLTASQALVSDSSKNVVSYPYTQNNTASSIVARDSSGNFSASVVSMTGAKISGLSASKGVATDGSMNLISTNLPFGVTSQAYIVSSTQSLSLQTRYFVSYTGGQMVGTLPAATGTGKTIEVIGLLPASIAGWKINAQSTDAIQLGSSVSTTGGYIISTPGSASDAVTFIDCELNVWVVYPMLGSTITAH